MFLCDNIILASQCFPEQYARIHDDVIKWKHFPRYWRRIHRSSVNSPHKGQWRGALMFSLICVWINGWVNNREAGDLRRYRAHYDVTVMFSDSMAVLFRNKILTAKSVHMACGHPCIFFSCCHIRYALWCTPQNMSLMMSLLTRLVSLTHFGRQFLNLWQFYWRILV